MDSDANGCSTTEVGQEQFESFYSEILKADRVQYDYRTPLGRLFSCVAKDLEDARKKRDVWMEKNDL